VASLVSHPGFEVLPSAYELQMPASPHASAAAEGVEIRLENIVRPQTNKPLVIEGAGGVLVPLNRRHFVIDIALQLQVPVILVSNLYLGSINHTLLTYEALKARRVPVLGIVFNGEPNPQSEDIILHRTGYKKLLHILPEQKIDTATIERYAEEFRKNIYELTGER
jgi:dethiobiotin synthetase